MAITTDVLERISKSNLDGSIPVLIDFECDKIIWQGESYGQENGHLRVVNDIKDVVYKGKRYIATSMSYTPPTIDGSTISGANLKISNMDKNISRFLRKVNEPFNVTVIASFLKIDTSVYFREISKVKSVVTTATWDTSSANMPLIFDTTADLMVPRKTATKQDCPSLSVEK